MGMMDEGSRRRRESSTPPARPRDVPKVPEEQVSLLTADEVEEVRAEARRIAHARKTEDAKKALLAQCVEEELRKLEPEQETREILIDLAPHAAHVLIDSRLYVHGQVYQVTRRVFEALREIISRSWGHDRAVGSPNRDRYRPISQVGGQNYVDVAGAPKNYVMGEHNADALLRGQGRRLS